MSKPVLRPYALGWYCFRCDTHGQVSYEPTETCDETFERIEESHALAQPDCHAAHGYAGLAVEAQLVRLSGGAA
jgi:hypothetical protein